MSNPTFDAAIAAELATLAPVTAPATEPLGYGTDLSCVLDVADDFGEVDPQSPAAIVQALLRRYVTPRGTLPDDQEYGLDVRRYCNRGVTLVDLRSLSGQMVSEARKDDRIDDATVEVTTADEVLLSRVLVAKVVITPADPALQAFTFTFAVTSAGVLTDTIGISN